MSLSKTSISTPMVSPRLHRWPRILPTSLRLERSFPEKELYPTVSSVRPGASFKACFDEAIPMTTWHWSAAERARESKLRSTLDRSRTYWYFLIRRRRNVALQSGVDEIEHSEQYSLFLESINDRNDCQRSIKRGHSFGRKYRTNLQIDIESRSRWTLFRVFTSLHQIFALNFHCWSQHLMIESLQFAYFIVGQYIFSFNRDLGC